MRIQVVQSQSGPVAVVQSKAVLIFDVQSALDLIATVSFETGHSTIVLDKSAICEEFFDLKTKLAGEILQKFTNYGVRLGIVGDFSQYTSKSLQDYIYESNQGGRIVFGPTLEAVIAHW
jgi:hypothetical protein